ncbi:hypothetical protein ACIBJE_29415, partial [Micromonospora sp. NPDC050187]
MNTMLRKTVLGVAGLAFAGGVVGGPVGTALDTSAHAAPATPVAAVQAEKPDTGKLVPNGVPGGQSRIPLDAEQTANVKAIVEATKKAGMDERAAVVAIATSLQESKLENLG